MCGVHPEAWKFWDSIITAINENGDWKKVIEENTEFELVRHTHHIDSSMSLNDIKAGILDIVNKLKPDIFKKNFRGIGVFPSTNVGSTSDSYLCGFIGALAGDLVVKETNKCITSWYFPRTNSVHDNNIKTFEICAVMKK